MPHQGLSERVKHIIQVELEAGLTPSDIAKANNVSVQTVRKYRRNLLESGSVNSSDGATKSIVSLYRRGNSFLNQMDYITTANGFTVLV